MKDTYTEDPFVNGDAFENGLIGKPFTQTQWTHFRRNIEALGWSTRVAALYGRLTVNYPFNDVLEGTRMVPDMSTIGHKMLGEIFALKMNPIVARERLEAFKSDPNNAEIVAEWEEYCLENPESTGEVMAVHNKPKNIWWPDEERVVAICRIRAIINQTPIGKADKEASKLLNKRTPKSCQNRWDMKLKHRYLKDNKLLPAAYELLNSELPVDVQRSDNGSVQAALPFEYAPQTSSTENVTMEAVPGNFRIDHVVQELRRVDQHITTLESQLLEAKTREAELTAKCEELQKELDARGEDTRWKVQYEALAADHRKLQHKVNNISQMLKPDIENTVQ